MLKVIDFTDENKEKLITEYRALGYTLIEEQRYLDGNHLVFDDGIPPRDLAAEIDDLKARVEDLEPGTPPLCTHWAVIVSIEPANEKPLRVRRLWGGEEYQLNCYVTEAIKDQYLAGDIAIGDYVLVEFLDDDPNRTLVFAKVFKTW